MNGAKLRGIVFDSELNVEGQKFNGLLRLWDDMKEKKKVKNRASKQEKSRLNIY